MGFECEAVAASPKLVKTDWQVHPRTSDSGGLGWTPRCISNKFPSDATAGLGSTPRKPQRGGRGDLQLAAVQLPHVMSGTWTVQPLLSGAGYPEPTKVFSEQPSPSLGLPSGISPKAGEQTGDPGYKGSGE